MSLDGIRGIATQIGRALCITTGDAGTGSAMGAGIGSGAAPPGDHGDGPGIPIFPL